MGPKGSQGDESPHILCALETGRDGGTGRRAGFKIRFPKGSGGSIPPPGTNNLGQHDEILFQLRWHGELPRSKGRQSRARHLRQLQPGALSEPSRRRRMCCRARWQNSALQASHRTALRVLDGSGGLHGAGRDGRWRRGQGNTRRSTRNGRTGSPVCVGRCRRRWPRSRPRRTCGSLRRSHGATCTGPFSHR